MESIVKAILAAGVALLVLAPQGAVAETPEQAALAAVAPFYDGLTAAPGKDVEGVLRRATAPEWVSCGANDVCGAREQVIAAIAGRHKAIPDLKWEIKEVLVSGNRVTVRGEATGTPAGEFMGVPHGGKSFRLMSIDVHTIEGGKIVRSYHVEDWLGAVRQLSGELRARDGSK
jgi:predicted ester cyclase